jgi:predicted TIM-barrel fold metal-dependent hydrolase
MILDCHVHTDEHPQSPADYLKSLDIAGIDKTILLSFTPASFGRMMINGTPPSPQEALKNVMDWAKYSDRIIPFFWIDPIEEEAIDQVDRAVDAGIAGFKVICNRHFPGDERALKVYERIAAAGKPMLFHSGILYSASPSSQYNRPAYFEPLFFIPKLRFAMAHVSWPWHDECLAVYGHWGSCKEKGLTSAEMFIDTTPGTPKIYREEVLRKIYTIGYDIEDNLIFGTDCCNDYSANYTQQILAMDKEALDNIGVSAEQREKYYHKNLLRFLGQ